MCLGERGWTRNRTKILSSVLENGKEGSKAGKRATGEQSCVLVFSKGAGRGPLSKDVEQEGSSLQVTGGIAEAEEGIAKRKALS